MNYYLSNEHFVYLIRILRNHIIQQELFNSDDDLPQEILDGLRRQHELNEIHRYIRVTPSMYSNGTDEVDDTTTNNQNHNEIENDNILETIQATNAIVLDNINASLLQQYNNDVNMILEEEKENIINEDYLNDFENLITYYESTRLEDAIMGARLNEMTLYDLSSNLFLFNLFFIYLIIIVL